MARNRSCCPALPRTNRLGGPQKRDGTGPRRRSCANRNAGNVTQDASRSRLRAVEALRKVELPLCPRASARAVPLSLLAGGRSAPESLREALGGRSGAGPVRGAAGGTPTAGSLL